MQFMQYDKTSAVKANSSSRIAVHTYAKAKITQAYAGVTERGAKFVALNFINEAGETAEEIKVYYENSQGEPLSGRHQLNAIMAFNGIPTLSQVTGNYKTYDFGAGGVVEKTGLIVPELIGKFMGIVLAENWYTNQYGEAKHTLQLTAVYHLHTGRNARQFIDDTPAIDGQIEQSIDYAKRLSAESRAKAEQGKGGQRQQSQYQGQGQQGQAYNPYQYSQSQGQGQQGQPYQQAPQAQVQAEQQQSSTTPQTVADEDMPF